MKEIIEKIGLDKMAHLGIGGLICAMFANILMLQDGIMGWRSLLYVVFAAIVVFVVSVFKEYFIDDKFDWADIAYAMLGCALYALPTAAGIALNLASQ